jgi:hypothetical protein
MTPKDKAEKLVDTYKVILIMSDTDAGDEILCTTIAKQCAFTSVSEILNDMQIRLGLDKEDFEYWHEVKQEIEKL